MQTLKPPLAAAPAQPPQADAAPLVRFRGVEKTYDGVVVVVRNLDLDIRRGEFLTLLGPSGSGKTTTLMMLAGFETPTAGEIVLDGRPITRTPPHKRHFGMVFQNYALFPHMSVGQNVAYPLTVRGVPKTEQATRMARALDMVRLTGMAERLPSQLSGGQQQRVALARALVFEPQLVLMDEPLGALDKQLREHMQIELKELHRQLGVTFVYVTHDQGEALTMSDRVAVMSQGVVQQVAPPEDIYENPSTPFVAGFVGETNRIPGRIAARGGNGAAAIETALGRFSARNPHGLGEGREALLFVRPERLTLGTAGIAATVTGRHFEGAFVNIEAEAAGTRLLVQIINDGRLGRLEPGSPIFVGFGAEDAVLLPPGPAA